MNGKSDINDDSQLDAAAILLSLKTTPPSFQKKLANHGKSSEGSTTTGYIPIYDWTQAVPTLSYAGNTYNINLQMYNSPIRLVPIPLNDQDRSSFKEMSIAFVKFCQIHRDTILLHDPTLAAGKVNERLVHLWTLLSDDEKVVYSKVAKNEMLLIQGKDISESKQIKSEPCSNNDSENKRRLFHQGTEKCSPSLFRHPMFSVPPKTPKKENVEDKVTLPEKSLQTSKIPKQRSISLSEKPPQKVFIRRTVSQEDMTRDNEKFAKPTLPDNASAKKYFIRMRRHSMNDSILSSAMEKINPYFTKNYSKSPLKSRNQYLKTSQLPASPKRNLSVTSLDIEQNSALKSPPKRHKNLPIEADIFDFKSEPHGLQIKAESEDDNNEDLRKAETYSYSLLKGASKTSSVNPCFSSRKTFVRKIHSIPTKCVNRLKQEYCSNKSKSSLCPYPDERPSNVSCTYNNTESFSNERKHYAHDRGKEWILGHGINKKKYNTNYIQKVIESSRPARSHGDCSSSTPISPANTPTIFKAEQADHISPTVSNLTVVTSSSLNSLKSVSGASNESKKLELLNDAVLLSHAIAELEDAEESRFKGSRRCHTSGDHSAADTRYRHVYKLFRKQGLNPTAEQITEFYIKHRGSFSCKSAALLTIREVKQKIIKLQLM